MKKYIGFISVFISIFIGILGIFLCYTNLGAELFDNIIYIFIIESIGFVLSIFSFLQNKGKILSMKILSILGIILNIFPICNFVLLFFTLG